VLSRRRLLATTASLAFLSTAGCLDAGELDDYALIGDELDLSRVGRPFLQPDPAAIDATTRVDFTAETKRQYTEELFGTGRVTAQQWPLVGRDRWGTGTRPRPTFLRRDGRFYRVRVADERRLRRDRWHFAVERTDEQPPADATVLTEPFGLSEQDTRVLDAALDAVYAGNDGFLGDPQFDEPQFVEYHRGLDADTSELVPSPPFAFVESGNERFRPVTEQRSVAVPEWTYTVDEITEQRREFDEYARSVVVERDLTAAGLSESAREAVDTAVSDDPGERYEERAPPSDTLSEILTVLGIADDLQPLDEYDDRVDFRNVVVEYRGSEYALSLIVTPD